MDYNSMLKEDLVAEVNKRKKLGRPLEVNAGNTKEDIIAALELDDQDDQDTADAAESDLPEGVPFAEVAVEDVALSNASFKGRYVNKHDGETYALAVIPNDVRGKTHKLKNTVHFTEGTEDWFRLNFDKA